MAKHRDKSSPGTNPSPAPSPFAALESLRATLPPGTPDVVQSETAPPPFSGKLVINSERTGRGGKTVTVIRGVQLDAVALMTLSRELRKALGSSGGIEGASIVLGGDLCERAAEWLRAHGAINVIIGN